MVCIRRTSNKQLVLCEKTKQMILIKNRFTDQKHHSKDNERNLLDTEPDMLFEHEIERFITYFCKHLTLLQ